VFRAQNDITENEPCLGTKMGLLKLFGGLQVLQN